MAGYEVILWCFGIFFCVLAAFALAYINTKTMTNRTIDVLSLNLWCHQLANADWWAGGSLATPDQANRLRRFGDWLSGYGPVNDRNWTALPNGGFDVLCLQEVFTTKLALVGGSQRNELIQRAVAAGYPHSFLSSCGLTTIQDAGLVLVSRYDFVGKPVFQPHPAAATWTGMRDVTQNKGFLAAVINHPRGIFVVINTHLNSHCAATRKKQLESIHKYVLQHHRDLPCLLCGDLNVFYGSQEYADMMVVLEGWNNAADRQLPTYGEDQLDYVMLRGNRIRADECRVVRLGRAGYNSGDVSDHAGVHAVLSLLRQ
jgi:endonuclease/exonuclease/phosphatase family metal-dependent hydrolase